jgi:uncharacterized membrane protein HdeD (DUF308 family)
MFINRFDNDLLKEFSTLSIISGILFIIAGAIAIIYPVVGSISITFVIATLFIVAGIVKSYLAFKAHRNSAGAFFKAFVLLLTGVLLFVYPVAGTATLAILLAVYFFIDGFSTLYMAFEFKPLKGWWLQLLNGVLSLLLGVLMIIDWPFSSLITVGIIVGISFIFDGVFMTYTGFLAKKL